MVCRILFALAFSTFVANAHADGPPARWSASTRGEGWTTVSPEGVVARDRDLPRLVGAALRGQIAAKSGDYAAVFWVGSRPAGKCRLHFAVRDDYVGGESGAAFAEVRAGDQVVWSADVAGGDPTPRIVDVDLPVGGRPLSFGIHMHRPVESLPVRVEFMDVQLIGASTIRLTQPPPAPPKSIGAEDSIRVVGVAAVDVTPNYPVRLSGFGFRRTESEGVAQRIWVKAIAFGADGDDPAILIATDNLGVPASMVAELAKRLAAKHGIKRERVCVTATHTHTAPMLAGVAPTLFGMPIPPEHQARIDRYTTEFLDNLEKAAEAALKNRRPSRVSWGVGEVGFAMNRRTKGGPVDHVLPLMAVRELDGRLRAVYFSYACHCVTMSNNRIGGDWAGYAQESFERSHPGALCIASVGCGADSNPNRRISGDKPDFAIAQGEEVVREIDRLLGNYLAPVVGRLDCRRSDYKLPFAKLPTREQWAELAKRKDAIGYHAQVQLARLDRGESLQTELDYSATAWTFGDSLAMVFLPGEVVVDYSLRLKRELDASRLWINAYANDDPCYIPSERILREGGYEGGGAMVYYDRPTKLAAGLENRIVDSVHSLLPPDFRSQHRLKSPEDRPHSPQQSLSLWKPKPGMSIQLVAAEPLVSSPVAINFGSDGRLWVAEMVDYPSGGESPGKPGGLIRVLRDTNGDGIYDTSTVFLDGISFPTGVMPWKKGVLITAAPDILYAEDTDGNGKADVKKVLFTGWATHNYHARVNGLQYGLDNWVHGSGSLFGAVVRREGKPPVDLLNRDFRLRPDTLEIESASGRAQQGRPRSDWDDWFGCDNMTIARHYPLPDHYIRRNPFSAPEATSHYVPADPDSSRLHPLRSVQMFQLSGPADYVTAGCGLEVYRDDALGEGFRGNLFFCEPVNLVVHRLQLTPNGETFEGHRAADEQQTEFLRTTDNWSRPVQAHTGPDGALWVVDMYRQVIEHPQWVPPEQLRGLDVRAGNRLGRIYRVFPTKSPPKAVPQLKDFDAAPLVAAMESPNGVVRDWAQQEIVSSRITSSATALKKVTAKATLPEARVQALSTLEGLGQADAETVQKALRDRHAGVRRHAVRIAEPLLDLHSSLLDRVLELVHDADPQVRLQVAFSLGGSKDARAGAALAEMATSAGDDPWMSAAVLSSINPRNVGAVASTVLGQKSAIRPTVLRSIARMIVEWADDAAWKSVADRIAAASPESSYQLATVVFDAVAQAKKKVPESQKQAFEELKSRAAKTVFDGSTPEPQRIAAVQFVARQAAEPAAKFAALLVPQTPPAVQKAIVAALGARRDANIPDVLLSRRASLGPQLQRQVLEVLLSRAAWRGGVVAALESGKLKSADFDADLRQTLLAIPDVKLRDRAAAALGRMSGDRGKLLAEWKSVASLHGDVANGKKVFAARCATCHRLDGAGFEVGPDLAGLTNRTPESLLIAVLNPNESVDPRYHKYLVQMQDGRSLSGIVVEETATSVTLREANGKNTLLLRRDVEAVSNTGQSLMPEGLEKDIKKQEMADLFAYLADRPLPPKKFPGNTPRQVAAFPDGRLVLAAEAAAIYGPEIDFELDHNNLGMWHSPQDRADWNVVVKKGGKYRAAIDFSCASDAAGNTVLVEAGDSRARAVVPATAGWAFYQTLQVGEVTLRPGANRVTVRSDGVIRNALLDLKNVVLTPVE